MTQTSENVNKDKEILYNILIYYIEDVPTTLRCMEDILGLFNITFKKED